MRQRARTDLCCGRSVMVVPTASVLRVLWGRASRSVLRARPRSEPRIDVDRLAAVHRSLDCHQHRVPLLHDPLERSQDLLRVSNEPGLVLATGHFRGSGVMTHMCGMRVIRHLPGNLPNFQLARSSPIFGNG
jgi:hypothetical protein